MSDTAHRSADKDHRKPELSLRQVPVQARAQQSRSKILEVAVELLEEVGMDDFNTNLLAERAEVKVRTVYRYFPNKFAIVATIGEEMFKRWSDWNEVHFQSLSDPSSDWEKTLRTMIDGWIARLTEEKGARALLQAIRSVPQLRELDVIAYSAWVGEFERAFRLRQPDVAPQITTVCHVTVSSVYGLIDYYFRCPPAIRSGLSAELAEQIVGRLRALLR